MFRHFRCRTALFVMLAAGAALYVNVAAPAFAQSDQIEMIRSEAEKSRAFADKQKKTAEEWKKRAEKARKNAAESKHQRDKDGWLEDAETYQKNAEKAQMEADNAEAIAARTEAELVEALKKLEKGPPPATASAPAPAPEKKLTVKPLSTSISVQDVFGVWQTDLNDSLFVIVPEQPGFEAYAYKLEAHTDDRVWKGEFSDFEEGDIRRTQDARVVFKYKPKPEEMNPEIPDWARSKISGQLEWEIELNEPDVCGAEELSLEGEFFPGKVKWDKEKKIVKLDGRGEGRKLKLKLLPDEPESAYVQTSIRVRPPGLGTRSKEDPDVLLPFSPLGTLVEKQLFHIDVSLPYEVAEKQGEKLQVTIRALGSGKSETRELLRAGMRKGHPVRYTHYNPIFFGSDKPFMSESWLQEVGSHSEAVDLGLKNGESVAIGFGETFETLPVYKTLEDYTIARYMQVVGYLQKVHNIRLTAPNTTKAEKEDAHIRLLRIKNFLTMMENSENPMWLKVLIANEYLGPIEDATQVLYNPAKVYGAGQIRITDINTEARMPNTIEDTWSNKLSEWERDGNNDRQKRFDGVVWSNGYERIRVVELVANSWRKKVRDALDGFMVNLTKGLYEWALSEASLSYGRFSIGVSDLFSIVSGDDHYGKKLPKGKRLEIIAQTLLANYTENVKTYAKDKMLDGIAGYQAPGDKGVTFADVRDALRGRNTKREKVKLTPPPGSQKQPDLPKTLSAKQQEAAAPVRKANSESIPMNEPMACAPPRSAGGSGGSDDGGLGHALEVAARYGENAVSVKQDGEGARTQDFGTCQAEAILNAAGVDMSPFAVLSLMADNNEAFRRKLQSSTDKTHPLTYGFTEGEMHLLAGLLGRESLEIPNGKLLSMEAIKNWRERGWNIKLAIHAEDYTGPGDNKHAIDVVKFEPSDQGCGMMVTIYDRALQATIKMPASDLQKRLADWPAMMHRKQQGVAVPSNIVSRSDASHPPRANVPKITAAEFNDLPEAAVLGLTVNEALAHLYPNGRGAPKINIMPRKYLKGMKNGNAWQSPEGGGASFSAEGLGGIRADSTDIAIRIRPGSEGHFEWTEFTTGNLVPHYIPPTGKWRGKRRNYIPPEHLQYLDVMEPGQPRWQNFPIKKGTQ